jgi:hypothetical protein
VRWKVDININTRLGSDSTLCDMIKISMENGSYNLKQDGNILNL